MTRKNEDQPHAKQSLAYHCSPRCGARRKYDGQPCQSPAVKNKARCRLHGGAKGSGAPKGNSNARKHGLYSEEMLRFKKLVNAFCRK